MGVELLRKISLLMFELWDPIGVNWNLGLSDEYDDYARDLLSLLPSTVNESAVFQVLERIELGLGLPVDPSKRADASRAISATILESGP